MSVHKQAAAGPLDQQANTTNTAKNARACTQPTTQAAPGLTIELSESMVAIAAWCSSVPVANANGACLRTA